MDIKLFKKSFPYICDKCGKFAHTEFDYCDKCGAENSLRKATKQDYKKHKHEIVG
jgi:rRNA maturation endonuclease Nob1